jgi:hypothetical protein
MHQNGNLQPVYSTTDSGLASYLHSQGIILDHIDGENFPTVFFFPNSPELQKLVQSFQRGEAIGNVVMYQRSYKILMSLIPHKTNRK